jgi:UDP-2,3-diacylglucosamine pyrophosphatase LpxH
MHDKFLERLIQCSDVYLLARLKDNRLAYEYPDDLRIFIPDLHLISSDREKKYKYTTNYQDLLKELMKKIKAFKTDPANNGKTIGVYQLGDFLDLWRQTPHYWGITEFTEEWEEAVQTIMDDKKDIIKLFQDPALKVNFLLGNHDFDLHNLAGFSDWNLKYYFPVDPINGASVGALHGDLFSLFEKVMPDMFQYLIVYGLGPLKKPSTHYLGEIRKKVIKRYKGRNFSHYIQQRTPPVLDSLIKIQEDQLSLDNYIGDDNFNVKKAGQTDDRNVRFLKESKELYSRINEELQWNLNTAVLAHTHHPRIAIDERGGEFFSVIDCGGWITKAQAIIDGDKKTFRNAQIGVLHNNDARIYQLFPKGVAPPT